MITISVINRKGGVGKTTMSAHIAAGLALRGYKVCLIDTDPQGSSAVMLGMEKENGVFDMLVNRTPIQNVIRRVPLESYATPDAPPTGEFWLIPGNTDTFIIPLKVQSPLALRTKIRQMRQQFNLDVVIIDTAPTASMFDGAVYFASDAVLYMTECETLSLDGLTEGMQQLDEHNQERVESNMEPLHVLGIVPNKYRTGTNNHREWLGQLKEAYPGLVYPQIPLKDVWSKATKYGQLLYSYAPTSGVTDAAWELVDSVEGTVKAWAVV